MTKLSQLLAHVMHPNDAGSRRVGDLDCQPQKENDDDYKRPVDAVAECCFEVIEVQCEEGPMTSRSDITPATNTQAFCHGWLESSNV